MRERERERERENETYRERKKKRQKHSEKVRYKEKEREELDRCNKLLTPSLPLSQSPSKTDFIFIFFLNSRILDTEKDST